MRVFVYLLRILFALLFLGCALFCVFGFFASGELRVEDGRLAWKIGYVIAASTFLVLAGYALFGMRSGLRR